MKESFSQEITTSSPCAFKIRRWGLLRFLPFSSVFFAIAVAVTQGQLTPNAWQISDQNDQAGVGGLFYTYELTESEKAQALSEGWRFTSIMRFPDAHFSHYLNFGHGDKRFFITWGGDEDGLELAVGGLPDGGRFPLESGDDWMSEYHHHEIIYNPATDEATYYFEGEEIVSWTGNENDTFWDGVALWGANASLGTGTALYQTVEFAITGGAVFRYSAGFSEIQDTAPDPTSQGWTQNYFEGAAEETPVVGDPFPMPCARIAYVDTSWSEKEIGSDPDNNGPAMIFGWDAFDNFPEARMAVCGDGTVEVISDALEITAVESLDFNATRVEFIDHINIQGGGGYYSLESSSTLAGLDSWSLVQTLEFQNLGDSRYEFRIPRPSEQEQFYRVVAWTTQQTDTDGDGLADTFENSIGTNPVLIDTDGDGFADSVEVARGTDPLDINDKPSVSSLAFIEFAEARTVVTEDASEVRIPLLIDRDYQGEILYSFGPGSSVVSEDFMDPGSGQVEVNGTEAEIVISLQDDEVLEEIETLSLTLLANPVNSYRRGAQLSHAIVIVDNDLQFFGTLVTAETISRFELNVTQKDGQSSARIQPFRSSGQVIGFFPSDLQEVSMEAWQFQDETLTATTERFSAGGSSLFSTGALSRELILESTPPAGPDQDHEYLFEFSLVDGVNVGAIAIGGVFQEKYFDSDGVLRSETQGSFSLTRKITITEPIQIPFHQP